MALPDETMVCSGHEYTAGNARFALTVEPDNAALPRAAGPSAPAPSGRPTVPSALAGELATNPFLRASGPAVKAALGMAGAQRRRGFRPSPGRRKDNF
jgi:hydroxyacylglutathione hydrolase